MVGIKILRQVLDCCFLFTPSPENTLSNSLSISSIFFYLFSISPTTTVFREAESHDY